jgi:cysteine-rich CPCC protein
MITCPCCGYRTITQEYDFCSVCRWQHDLAQEAKPFDSEYGANPVTLKEAQSNFMAIGASAPHRLDVASLPDPDDGRDPEWKPLPERDRFYAACACCGYFTIGGPFDCCDICGWLHDVNQEGDPYTGATGSNQMTLFDAQRNFAVFGASRRDWLPLARSVGRHDRRDPSWKPLSRPER